MSRKRRLTIEDLSAEFVVGLFFFLAMVILAYFTIILSKDAFMQDRWTLRAEFDQIAGLTEGDAVMARGVHVGTIKDVALVDSKVLVSASMTEDLTIYEGYSVEVRYSSILGGRYMSIHPGSSDADAVPQVEILEGDSPADVLSDTSDLVRELKTQVDELSATFEESDVIPKIAKAVDDLQAITAQIREGEGTLGRLVQDEGMYETAVEALTQLKEGADSLNRVASNIDGAVTDARAGKGTIGKLLTEDRLHKDLEALVADLRKTATSLGDGESSLGRIVNDDGELYDKLLNAVENTKEISGQIRKGDGTVGKLVMDESLYDEIRGTVIELRNAIEDFREQAPISTFGSFIFGAL